MRRHPVGSTKKKKLITTRLRLFWARQALRRWYYRMRHGITFGLTDGSMLPELGPGRFVSLHRRGEYLDIVSHRDAPDAPAGTIRLIPFQPNHGVMVEFWQDGRLRSRTNCSYAHFVAHGHARSEQAWR